MLLVIATFCLTRLPKNCPLLPYMIFFCPTCSAGLGVLNMAVQAVSRMSGCSETAAKSQFFLIDKNVCFHCLCLHSCIAIASS